MTFDTRPIQQLAAGASWQAITQAPATLALSTENDSLTLEFDFHDSGGFVVARLPLNLALPQRFTFCCQLSGDSPANQLEFKLADTDGNCWRYLEPELQLSDQPRPLEISEEDLSFAWGPAGDGPPKEISAIEIALVAGPGGKGQLLLSGLSYEDRGDYPPPAVYCSSQPPYWSSADWWQGQSCWHPDPSDERPWLCLAFDSPRPLGGLSIQWLDQGCHAWLESDDNGDWYPLAEIAPPVGETSHLWLPDARLQRLRLRLDHPQGIRGLNLIPPEAGRSAPAYWHQLASQSPRGHYPRHLLREQSYWTSLGTPAGSGCALLNEEAQVEIDQADACLDPFLYLDDQLIGWADAEHQPALTEAGLPLPGITRQLADRNLSLEVQSYALDQCLLVDYRLRNLGQTPRQGRFLLALRPFQLTPPWQSGHRHYGNMGRLHQIHWDGQALQFNQGRQLRPDRPPEAVGATSSARGEIINDLAEGRLPSATSAGDVRGWASAALSYEFDLAADGCFQLSCLLPYQDQPTIPDKLLSLSAEQRRAAAIASWQGKLVHYPRFQLPAVAQDAAETACTALGHILLQRDGQILQPGPRRYTRAWIRDGVTLSAALLRAGCQTEVADFLRWYAEYQAEDGNIPCCIDPDKADWLVEHDSLGQFLFGLWEYRRFSGDTQWLTDLQPRIRACLDFMQSLLQQECSDPLAQGLLPVSASHEGYLAHHVHAYWDNFCALRGLDDALAMADQIELNREELASLRDDFHQHLARSLEGVRQRAEIDYVPGSLELADFDPAATATAIAWLDELPGVPDAVIQATFDRYLEGFRQRRDGKMPWHNYSAYEIRIIAALVRLGRRDEAHELLAFFLADRRPLAWNQWPEISWHDPRSPGHLGDLPHAWIGAEFTLAWLTLFAYERHPDQSLVLAAGIPADWLANSEVVQAQGLLTYWGQVDLSLRQIDDQLQIQLGGDYRMPPGGIHIRPPMIASLNLTLNGQVYTGPDIHLSEKPA